MKILVSWRYGFDDCGFHINLNHHLFGLKTKKIICIKWKDIKFARTSDYVSSTQNLGHMIEVILNDDNLYYSLKKQIDQHIQTLKKMGYATNYLMYVNLDHSEIYNLKEKFLLINSSCMCPSTKKALTIISKYIAVESNIRRVFSLNDILEIKEKIKKRANYHA